MFSLARSRASRFTAVVTVVGLLWVVGGCAGDKQVISQASGAHGQIKPAVMTDRQLSAYLQQVGDRVIAAAQKATNENPDFAPSAHRKGEDTSWMFKNIEFHLVNSETLNAFTTGGNHVYIYSSLMEKCETEDELAAVVAHEYAHIYCRHVQGGMRRQQATLAGAAAAGVAGAAVGYSQNKAEGALQYGTVGAGVGMLAGQYLGMGYTREDEAEADKYGFRFYVRAGWDPQKFGNFFQRMADMGLDTTNESMSDHPSLKSRVAWSKKAASELSPNAKSYRRAPIADAAEFSQLRKRAIAVGKQMPSDKTLASAQELLAAFSSCVAPVDQPEQAQVKRRAAAAATNEPQPEKAKARE